MKFLRKFLTIIVISYLVLPFLIFVGGWTKIYIAFPIIIVVLWCAWKVYKDMPDLWLPEWNQDNIIKLLFIIGVFAIWVYYSGIGKFVFQNTDHSVRNEIFNMLVKYDWPIISKQHISGNVGGATQLGLIYYIVFWLPSAVVGKVLGLRTGYYAQALWALLGIVLVYLLMCSYFKKLRVWPVFVFIFFSGLDILGAYLTNMDYTNIDVLWHLEWWGAPYEYSSMTTQLFWVFNQAIPVWLCTMLIYIQKNNRNLVFIVACSMLTSTLPFIGLFAITIFLCLSRGEQSEEIKRKTLKQRVLFLIKDTCTIQNVLGGGVIGILSFCYLSGNLSGTHVMAKNTLGPKYDNSIAKYVLFIILDLGIYVVLLYKYQKEQTLYYFVVAILLIIPWIKIGSSSDFCMRASIPGLFLIMIWVINALVKAWEEKMYIIFAGLILTLLIGSVTPIFELRRTFTETYHRLNTGSIVYEEDCTENEIFNSANFSGNIDESLFYKYFAK